jgi:hypothetical protein
MVVTASLRLTVLYRIVQDYHGILRVEKLASLGVLTLPPHLSQVRVPSRRCPALY